MSEEWDELKQSKSSAFLYLNFYVTHRQIWKVVSLISCACAFAAKTFSPRRSANDSVLPSESAVPKTQENDMENDREIVQLMIGKSSTVVEACELCCPEYASLLNQFNQLQLQLLFI